MLKVAILKILPDYMSLRPLLHSRTHTRLTNHAKERFLVHESSTCGHERTAQGRQSLDYIHLIN